MRQISEIVHSRSARDREPAAARAGDGEVKVVDFVCQRLIRLEKRFDAAAFIQCAGRANNDAPHRQTESLPGTVLTSRPEYIAANTVLDNGGGFCPCTGSLMARPAHWMKA